MDFTKAHHAFSALVVAILWLVSMVAFEPLRDGPASVFSTLFGFITVYGLVVAIVEIGRTKSVLQLVSDRAKNVTQDLEALYSSRDIAECQICIESSLAAIDEMGSVPLPTLAKILKIYSREFAPELTDKKSEHSLCLCDYMNYMALPSRGRTQKNAAGQAAMTTMTSLLARRKPTPSSSGPNE